jgi:hypothetical protein
MPDNRMDDADKMVVWLREAADELEKAHNLLDEAGVPRIRRESGNAMTLAARIYTLAAEVDYWRGEAERFRNVLSWLEENYPAAIELCPFKAPTEPS